MPRVPMAMVDAHARAHAELTEQVRAAPPAVRTAWERLSTRLLVEGLAKVQPVLADVDRPLLVPAPRRFLSRRQAGRRRGAEAAFRHIDAKVAMVRMGAVGSVVDSSTAPVLNALLEAPAQGERETNPGLVRATPTHWAPEANPTAHPPAQWCRTLLRDTIEEFHAGDAPDVIKAGWLAFTLMTVHPFVDGNGRTARACALAVLGAGAPLGVDWGVLDQWGLARIDYVDALQAGQRAERYAADAVDPRPFVEFTAVTSTQGAAVSAARLAILTTVATQLATRRLSESEIMLVLLVVIDRFVAADALALAEPMSAPAAGTPRSAAGTPLDTVADLVERGALRWVPRPAGAGPDTPPVGVALGPLLADIAAVVTHARLGDQLRPRR